jgi:hypothetical protein
MDMCFAWNAESSSVGAVTPVLSQQFPLSICPRVFVLWNPILSKSQACKDSGFGRGLPN